MIQKWLNVSSYKNLPFYILLLVRERKMKEMKECLKKLNLSLVEKVIFQLFIITNT